MKYVLVGLLVAFLAGCLKTRSEIEAENNGQEQTTVSQQQAAAKPAPYKEKAPPAGYRFVEIDEELRTMSGRLDSVENAISQMNAAKANDGQNANKEKQALDQKFATYEDALKKMDAEIQALTDDVAKLKAPPPPPAPEPAAVKDSGKGKDKKGNKEFDAADELFTAKKFKDAIVHFSKYREQNPKGKKYAEATYKIGVSFQELGMKDEARSFLEEVTAKFPNSKEGKKAAQRLKQKTK